MKLNLISYHKKITENYFVFLKAYFFFFDKKEKEKREVVFIKNEEFMLARMKEKNGRVCSVQVSSQGDDRREAEV